MTTKDLIYDLLQPVLGKMTNRPAKLDKKLVRELKALADPDDPYETVQGKTMCADDFYEGKIMSMVKLLRLASVKT